MKYIVIFLLLPVLAFSQNKGVSPIANSQQQTATKNTYAVVVGISDYQDKDIPDLRFADKDAAAFAEFLRSEAGGKLDKDHLKVLLNQEATMAQFAIALDWLWENVREGDQAIIYFSGHGDVEKKSLTQPGFLLCWDAPARVYMSGGAFALPMLQEVISTLSIQNKAKVIVITDACRSGALAGNSISGSQATASNLSKQFANEIKILSCQPNEYSIEGEQWGGGRGAFSFNLVNALYGLADGNMDLSITLQEIGRYLEDHVPSEVAPVSQLPMVLGNRNEKVATVYAPILAALRSGKSSQMTMLSSIDSRGMEDEVLAGLDTSVVRIYNLFKQALKDKIFLEPAIANADSYYERLMAEPKMQRLHSTMRRNYAAALQDEAQQVLNSWLRVDMDEIAQSRSTRLVKYTPFPRALERAAQLLGSSHYAYKDLLAKKYLFEGFLAYLQNPENLAPATGRVAMEKYARSLSYQPAMPQTYLFMSYVENFNFHRPDSAMALAMKAAALAPQWLLPYTATAKSFMLLFPKEKMGDAAALLEKARLIDSTNASYLNVAAIQQVFSGNHPRADQLLAQALKVDSNYVSVWGNLAGLRMLQGRAEEAEHCCRRAIEIDSTYAFIYVNLGVILAQSGRPEAAIEAWRTGLRFNSTEVQLYGNLGFMLSRIGNPTEAIAILQEGLEWDSTNTQLITQLGGVLLSQNDFTSAERLFKKCIQLDSKNTDGYYKLACLYGLQNRLDEAFETLEKALKIGFEYDWLQKDPELAPLREQKEKWEVLMKKYFANQMYYNLACNQSIKGELDKAFESLELSITNGWNDYHWMQQDPDLAPLRTQAEHWKALMKKHFPDQFKD